MNRTFWILVPLLLLGAGCAQKTQVPINSGVSSSSSASVLTGETFGDGNVLLTLPTGWKVESFERKPGKTISTTKILVAEKPYQTKLVMQIAPEDISIYRGQTPIATTQNATFYTGACGGCWFGVAMDVKDDAESAHDYFVFLGVESTEPPPENYDAPWMSNPVVSKEEVMEMLKTVRPVPR
ncbi:hypothetical protein HYW18_04005 [Candidatus Uhrbacteria bacterium]|nr:hypothetical protein [Candidatus Uhrbacteria bacterium]